MSTPPAPTAPGITQDQIKTLLEAAVIAGLNPGADPDGWKVSRYHFDEFLSDTDQLVSLSFVVGIGQTSFQGKDRQHVNRANGPKATVCTTQVRVKLATRARGAEVKADSTKHLAWAGAVLRSLMVQSTELQTIYRTTQQSQSLSSGQVLVSEHVIDVTHLLPLE